MPTRIFEYKFIIHFTAEDLLFVLYFIVRTEESSTLG